MPIGRVKHIIYRKLGREDAWGLAGHDTIEIDPRTKGRKRMETIHHEALHVIFPNMDEETVTLAAKELTRVLWRQNYRQIDNDKGQPLQTKRHVKK